MDNAVHGNRVSRSDLFLGDTAGMAYEAVVERFIGEAARGDGSLPVETFFEAWAAIESRKMTVEVQAQIEDDHLVLIAPPDSPLTVQDNRIWLKDGLQVVIRLVSAQASAR